MGWRMYEPNTDDRAAEREEERRDALEDREQREHMRLGGLVIDGKMVDLNSDGTARLTD